MGAINIPRVEYRGYNVDYSDNSDTWSCHELSISGAKSPQAVAARIDAIIAKSRKTTEKIPALKVDSHGGLKPVDVFGLAEMSDYERRNKEQSVWVWEDKGRRKCDIAKLVDLSHPDTAARIADHEKARAVLKVAREAFAAAEAALPRLTPASLKTKEIEE